MKVQETLQQGKDPHDGFISRRGAEMLCDCQETAALRTPGKVKLMIVSWSSLNAQWRLLEEPCHVKSTQD